MGLGGSGKTLMVIHPMFHALQDWYGLLDGSMPSNAFPNPDKIRQHWVEHREAYEAIGKTPSDMLLEAIGNRAKMWDEVAVPVDTRTDPTLFRIAPKRKPKPAWWAVSPASTHHERRGAGVGTIRPHVVTIRANVAIKALHGANYRGFRIRAPKEATPWT
jgi:hypothetical protein